MADGSPHSKPPSALSPRVLITETLGQTQADWLAQRAEVSWVGHDDGGFDAALAQADGLVVRTYTRVTADLLARAPRLKVVGRAGVGLDNIDVEACRQRGVAVVSTPDANTQAVVEYVIGLMLDRYRPRTDLTPDADFHGLRKTEVGRQLSDLTLGILGFGRIGKRLGKAAHALGINLRVCDVLPEAQLRKAVDYPYYFDTEPACLLDHSDIVSVHVDGRASNRHMIDADLLARLRDDALLLNAARGMLHDPAALAAWAKAHPRGRVVLDVHDPEPPPPDDILFDLPNVRLLPHLASRTDTALGNMSWVVRDVDAVLRGQTPVHLA